MWNILTILSAHFSDSNSIHKVMKPFPPPISKSFFFSYHPNRNFTHPVNNSSVRFPGPQPLVTSLRLSDYPRDLA